MASMLSTAAVGVEFFMQHVHSFAFDDGVLNGSRFDENNALVNVCKRPNFRCRPFAGDLRSKWSSVCDDDKQLGQLIKRILFYSNRYSMLLLNDVIVVALCPILMRRFGQMLMFNASFVWTCSCIIYFDYFTLFQLFCSRFLPSLQ